MEVSVRRTALSCSSSRSSSAQDFFFSLTGPARDGNSSLLLIFAGGGASAISLHDVMGRTVPCGLGFGSLDLELLLG